MGKTVPMDKRLLAITAAQLAGVTVTGLCAELGISRKTFYEWRKRFDKEGQAGLEPRSRRPLTSPHQTPAEVEQHIVRLREQLPLDNGALAIFYQMRRAGFTPLPSVRTIHRVLVREGLVEPQPKKRPRSSWLRFEYDAPNACWQIDATQWELRDGRTAWIMDLLDDHSRYMPAADAVAGDTLTAAWDAFCHAAQEIGPPAKVLSDNGLCFSGGSNADGGGTFARNLAGLGIAKANSRPYHPQTCGKLERAQCATSHLVVSPVQPGGTRREVPGSDGLPVAERWAGTRACQETSGRVQLSGTVRWETRVIWRKLDCLNPNLQMRQVHLRRNGTSDTGASPASRR